MWINLILLTIYAFNGRTFKKANIRKVVGGKAMSYGSFSKGR